MILNKLIYDIGLNDGIDTDYYLKLGYNVVCVDANPEIIKDAIIKYKKEIIDDRVILLNVGISNNIDILKFYISKKSIYSSFIEEKANLIEYTDGIKNVIKINTIKLIDLIKIFGIPYYMKIDIEGYDMLAIETLTTETKSKYISVEYCDYNILDKLKSIGYNKFKFISQINIEEQNNNKNDIKFKLHSSGNFGENTPGEWMNYDIIKNDIKLGWFDIHATF
jgi:FkbM family methyltransferase